ncbi:WecB/TagA/CpsF family glycosyltransferase [Mucilaginibacter litoreus]|uniref:WecB/TagA/CpsF family glycosyltransferase n=1 Tax=Mucilaginibacter litoreus TaxID=1048221 RepID=A0ABW3AV64_9SPHI
MQVTDTNVVANVDTIKILNIDICNISKTNLLKQLTSGVLVTPNVDHLVKLQSDRNFYECYKNSDWIICDSKIVNLAAKFLGKSFYEVIPGSSLLPAFYNFHKNNKNIRLFLLGAGPGIADIAKVNINNKVGWNMVVGAHSPSFGFEKNNDECEEIINIINSSGANVLVVGVGAPKQEKWIMKYKERLKSIDLFMALGATIDFEAGTIKRAPQLLQTLHLEWLFRLSKEPGRLWKRYLVESLPFFNQIIKQKYNTYKNPFADEIKHS